MRIIEAQIYWHDDYDNAPSVQILLDEAPLTGDDRVWDKIPARHSQLSAEQEAIVGRENFKPDPDWYAYAYREGGFCYFFTWGGKPDQGFGGLKRTIRLSDGTEEEIIGGWFTSPRVLNEADPDSPPVMEVSYTADPKVMERGHTFLGGFYSTEEVHEAVLRCNPDVELGEDGAWKLKGYPTKAEWRTAERTRSKALKKQDNYDFRTSEHKEEYKIRPYSTLPEMDI